MIIQLVSGVTEHFKTKKNPFGVWSNVGQLGYFKQKQLKIICGEKKNIWEHTIKTSEKLYEEKYIK